MADTTTSAATEELLTWLVSSFDSADGTWKQLLGTAVDACDDDQLALFSMLGRLEHFAPQCNRDKWLSMVRELEHMEAHGDLTSEPAVKTQLLRLKLRFPSTDLLVTSKAPQEKRLSAHILRNASSLEANCPSILARSARVLRRALTSDENDRRPPLLERTVTLSQRSGNAMTSSLKNSFLSRLSLVLQGGVEDTYFCFICFENVPDSQGFTLSMCGHRYCEDCLVMYLEVKIRDGEVYPTCFHDVEDAVTGKRVACGAPVISLDIEAIVSADVWTKYERFKFNKEFEHGRQCPYCGHSQNCDGPEHPESMCQKCCRSFCFIHSNAHAGGTCADFERANLEAEKLNRTAIAKFAKPCPGCKSNVEKNGGCNHMTCVACQTNFCWICGKTVDNVTAPDHFAWWNISGCAGQQLTDVDNQSWVERVGWRFFRVLFLAICVPIATVITLVLTILTGCCIPCICWIQEDPKETFLGTVNTIALYVQLLVALVVLGPLSVVAFLVRGLRRLLNSCRGVARSPRFSEDIDTSGFVVDDDFEIAFEVEVR